jgi:hypothetical protein
VHRHTHAWVVDMDMVGSGDWPSPRTVHDALALADPLEKVAAAEWRWPVITSAHIEKAALVGSLLFHLPHLKVSV